MFLLKAPGLSGFKDTPLKYLEGQGVLVTRLMTPINHRVAPVIPSIMLFAKSR